MPGMRLRQGGWFARVRDGWEWDDSKGPILPDLTDPATLGCLLALVREAWMCPKVSVRYEMGRIWRCVHQDGAWLGEGKSEAEALVAALEAAEGREVSDE